MLQISTRNYSQFLLRPHQNQVYSGKTIRAHGKTTAKILTKPHFMDFSRKNFYIYSKKIT